MDTTAPAIANQTKFEVAIATIYYLQLQRNSYSYEYDCLKDS